MPNSITPPYTLFIPLHFLYLLVSLPLSLFFLRIITLQFAWSANQVGILLPFPSSFYWSVFSFCNSVHVPCIHAFLQLSPIFTGPGKFSLLFANRRKNNSWETKQIKREKDGQRFLFVKTFFYAHLTTNSSKTKVIKNMNVFLLTLSSSAQRELRSTTTTVVPSLPVIIYFWCLKITSYTKDKHHCHFFMPTVTFFITTYTIIYWYYF